MPPDQDRWMGLLDGVGMLDAGGELVETPLELGDRLGPEALHRLHLLLMTIWPTEQILGTQEGAYHRILTCTKNFFF